MWAVEGHRGVNCDWGAAWENPDFNAVVDRTLVCYLDIFPLVQILSNFHLFWPVFHESIRLSVADADLAASPDPAPAHDGDGGASEKEAAGEGPAGKTNT